MAQATLPVRFYRQYPEPGQKNTESSHGHAHTTIQIDTQRTALVLIDIWDATEVLARYGWSPGLTEDIRRRVENITRQHIAPSLAAARRAGVCIVHAPSDYVAMRYPQHRKLAQRMAKRCTPSVSLKASQERAWPPREFTEELHARRYEHHYGPGSDEINCFRKATSMIHPAVAPLDEEFVVADSNEMDLIFRDREILYLFYAGFATNMCLMDKPGAIRDRHGRGYELIVLRDCTSAVETLDTCEQETMTRDAIRLIEMSLAWTATSADFMRALEPPGDAAAANPARGDVDEVTAP